MVEELHILYIFEKLYDQTLIDESLYSIHTMDFLSNKFEHVTNFYDKLNYKYPFGRFFISFQFAFVFSVSGKITLAMPKAAGADIKLAISK